MPTALSLAAALATTHMGAATAGAGANGAPSIDAGEDRRLTLPETSVCLDADATDDGLPGPLTVTWSKTAGPSAPRTPYSPTASTAALSGPGSYVFQAEADDGQLTATDTTSVVLGNRIDVPGDAATIQAGVDMAVDGDTVLVGPGVWNESIEVDNKEITLASHYLLTGDPADRAATIIDGGGADWGVRFSSGVGPETAIIGFHVRNATDGIYLFAPMNVLDNHVTGTHDAIEYKDDTGGLARGNILEFNSDDAIDINRKTAVVVEQNILRHNGGDGIENRMKDYDGPEILESIYRDNLIYDNEDDGIQLINYTGYSPRSFIIEGNKIFDNGQAGLGIMGDGNTHENFEGFGGLEPIFLRNNVFSGNDHGVTGGHALTATNNIFVDHVNIALKNVDGGSIATHNIFWNNGTDVVSSNVDPSTTYYVDPLLDADLNLLAASPAIDAGTDVGLPFAGAAPDLGAEETPLNAPPLVDAGADMSAAAGEPVPLGGSAIDDDLPLGSGTLATTWEQITGDCGVVFADPTSPTSAVTFPVPGVYRLRLTADDGWEERTDETIVTVTPFRPRIRPFGVVVEEGNSGTTTANVLVYLEDHNGDPHVATETHTVDYTTFDTTHPRVAKEGSDYIATSGTLTINPGQSQATVPVEVIGDTTDEPPLLYGEWGLVAFDNPSPNARLDLSFYGLALFIIIDDD